MDILTARILAQKLTPGTPVILTQDGQDIPCTVQGTSSSEPGGFGHPDSRRITVGFGPGRWNTEITPAGIAGGYYGVRLA